ncbi:peroxiredoxin family protein [Pedobacter chinensis]|nr:TlpA disulfide reductase family protein [Pedobacter chinensis]
MEYLFLKKFIKIYFFSQLICLSYLQVMAQSSKETTQSSKPTTYLLPDGKVFPIIKWDSLEQAWGKGRIMFMHNEEDDKKGIIHLVRLTDEMKQKIDKQKKEKEDSFAAMLNKPAPDFELPDMQGKHWSLKALRGKIIVLNFWFTSCVPCIQEMPELNKLVQAYANKDIVFLALTFNSAEQVKAFLEKRTFSYTVLPDSGDTDKKYAINSWPTSMVIDKEGNIKLIIQSSPKIQEELGGTIDSLL